MPRIFKTLASIATWVLFVFGIVGLIINSVESFGRSDPYPGAVYFAVWGVFPILSVVAMKLRKTLE